MQIFVTGDKGFVGRELSRQCREAGYEVRGIDLPGDIRRELVYSIPEGCVVVHLAALSTDALCEADPLEALDVNVAGTINVAKAARRRNCKQFIFASTEKVYPEGPELQREDGETFPCGNYVWSKHLGEEVMRLSGLPNVTVLRFGIAYGCRDSNWCAVEKIAGDVVKGRPPFVGNLDTARRYVHVRDLVAGILASVGRTGHETFNLPGAELITLKQVWEAATAAHGSSTDILSVNDSTPSVRNADGTKARDVLGWTPKIPFAEGMKEVVEYLKGRK